MMVRAYSVGCFTPFKMQGFLRTSYRRVGVISTTLPHVNILSFLDGAARDGEMGTWLN